MTTIPIFIINSSGRNWTIYSPAVPRVGEEIELSNGSYVVSKVSWTARNDNVFVTLEVQDA